MELQWGGKNRSLPLRRMRVAISALLLAGYMAVYLLPDGRLAPHWPLDLAAIAIAALAMALYAVGIRCRRLRWR